MGVTVIVGVMDGVGVGERPMVGVTEGVMEGVTVGVAVGVIVGVMEGVGVGLGVHATVAKDGMESCPPA